MPIPKTHISSQVLRCGKNFLLNSYVAAKFFLRLAFGRTLNFRETLNKCEFVTPAKAGVQLNQQAGCPPTRA